MVSEQSTKKSIAPRLDFKIQKRFSGLFDENDAAQLALLISELRKSGQQMGFFDAAIAATVMARGDTLLCLDSDFDRLKEKIDLLKP